jgi:hypothetical protein
MKITTYRNAISIVMYKNDTIAYTSSNVKFYIVSTVKKCFNGVI